MRCFFQLPACPPDIQKRRDCQLDLLKLAMRYLSIRVAECCSDELLRVSQGRQLFC